MIVRGLALLALTAATTFARAQEPASTLSALVRDATAEDRLVLESAGLDFAFAELAKGGATFAPLDRELALALSADPAKARGKFVRVRGRIDELESFAPADGKPALERGRLRLDDGDFAYFVAAESPKNGAKVDDRVELKAMFVKLYSREASNGWLEAPLFVAQQLERPKKSAWVGVVASAIGAATATLLTLFVQRLRKEGRKSPELQAELAHRRVAAERANSESARS